MKSSSETAGRTERNLGIDLLRLIAIALIVMLHIMNQAGLMSCFRASGLLMEQIGNNLVRIGGMGVTLFALISGFVMLPVRWKPERFLALWLQVVVLSLSLCVIGELIEPGSVESEFWIRSAFPVTQRCFWYFSCYSFVFLLSPLINRSLLAMNRRQIIALFWGVLGLASGGSFLGYLYYGDTFAIAGGFSAMWLVCMYIVGACVRKERILFRAARWKLLLCALFLILLNALIAWIVDLNGLSTAPFSKYSTPFLVLACVLLLVLCANWKPQGRSASGLIRVLAPLSFGVYVIHVHNTVWSRLELCLLPFRGSPWWQLLLLIPGVMLAIFLPCAAYDWLRLKLFRLLRVDRFCAWVVGRLHGLWDRLYRSFADPTS